MTRKPVIKPCLYCSNLFQPNGATKYCSELCHIKYCMLPRSTDPDDCIAWRRKTPFKGYASSSYKAEEMFAHRRVYRAFIGPLDDEKEIMHSCDNIWCVNPLHLSQGTHSENMRDMADKGRAKPRPRTTYTRKITPEMLDDILTNEVDDLKTIAKRHNLNPNTVGKQRWRAGVYRYDKNSPL